MGEEGGREGQVRACESMKWCAGRQWRPSREVEEEGEGADRQVDGKDGKEVW